MGPEPMSPSPLFADRTDAGDQLARRLEHLADASPVVLGLPRGGVPVAARIADRLGAPLDVVLVRKLGVPARPELAMGAIGENGVRIIDTRIVQAAGVDPRRLARVERHERAELQRRAQHYRGDRPPPELTGRTALIVDDGIATGSTARAACAVARHRGADRVVLAVPVGPPGWAERLADAADERVSVATPEPFPAIGVFYADFTQTTDAEVLAALAGAHHDGPGP